MKTKVFYSYSHKDEQFRVQLETHLAILRRSNIIEEWHDRRISPGSNWEEEINESLDEADIILLLVSSNFLASEYCYDTETVRALERHDNKEATIIPIILQPCLWQISHFANSKIQALPTDGKPITSWGNEEEAWLNVAEGILQKAEEINNKTTPKNANTTLENVTDLNNKTKEDLIKDFLCNYSRWYFSPLRIVKWGGKQSKFEQLSQFTSLEVSEILKSFVNKGIADTKLSQKGNPIYKMKKNVC